MHTEHYLRLGKVAKQAIDVQDASNLSGVLMAWHKASVEVANVVGTNHGEAFWRHPINILFMSKVASLLRMNTDCIGGVTYGERDLFTHAYAWCKSASKAVVE